MKQHTIIHCTQVAVNLSLTVVTRGQNGTRLHLFNLVSMTPLIFWLWSGWQMIRRAQSEALKFFAALIEVGDALEMAAGVYVIWAKIIGQAIWYGISP